MKFVRKGSTLYIDKQTFDDSDLLDRLRREISQKFPLEPSAFTRTKKRFAKETLAITFSLIETAKAAENWVDNDFEA